MRRAALLLLPACLATAAAPACQEFTLPNGLRVRLAENHDSPALSVRLVLRSAGLEESMGKPGLEAWLAALVEACGAGPYATRAALVQAREEVGLRLAFTHGEGRWTWNLDTESRLQDQAMEHLAHAAFRPLWDPALAERCRRTLVETLRERAPGDAAEARFKALLGLRAAPASPEDLKKRDAADLDALRSRLLQPGRALLALQGDLTLSQARQLALLHFGTWGAAPDEPERPAVAQTPVKSVVMEQPGAAVQIWLGAGLPTDIPEAAQTAKLLAFALQGGSPDPEALRWEVECVPGRAGLWLRARIPPGSSAEQALDALRKRWEVWREWASSEETYTRARAMQAAWEAASSLHPQRGMDGLCAEGVNGVPSLQAYGATLRRWMDGGAVRVLVLGPGTTLTPRLESLGLGPVECVAPVP